MKFFPEENEPSILRLAILIARKAHKGQKRRNGEPYINHPLRVAENFEDYYFKSIAWLHDVIEDSPMTEDFLVHLGITPTIARVVKLLSREKEQDYVDYILKIKKNADATKVKVADLLDNLTDLPSGNMKDKYLLALYILDRKKIVYKFKDGNRCVRTKWKRKGFYAKCRPEMCKYLNECMLKNGKRI